LVPSQVCTSLPPLKSFTERTSTRCEHAGLWSLGWFRRNG
jgi:hypothetical protein